MNRGNHILIVALIYCCRDAIMAVLDFFLRLKTRNSAYSGKIYKYFRLSSYNLLTIL